LKNKIKKHQKRNVLKTNLTHEELSAQAEALKKQNLELIELLKKSELQNKLLNDKIAYLLEQNILLKQKKFGKSSEKKASSATTTGDDLDVDSGQNTEEIKLENINTTANEPTKKEPKKRVRLPSERYPNASLLEIDVELKEVPLCSCCTGKLSDSGMTEDTEYLAKIPEQFYIIREKKHKYRCESCHGDIKTAPNLPRIKPGSAFSDEFIMDVAVKKFDELIPIERQVRMAAGVGFYGLPPQSLIELTHYFATFLKEVFEKIKNEVLTSRILHADETPQNMLEGDETKNWYFWGFSSKTAAFFEAHDTRSGDVAYEVLIKSNCKYLMSDVYSGYKKALRIANEERLRKKLDEIIKIYCNAHARRKFKDAAVFKKESEYFVEQYEKIYYLNSQAKDKSVEEILELRSKMRPIFNEMKLKAESLLEMYSTKSAIVSAASYFVKNFDELTLFTLTPDAPIDNNSQENLLRNPVIGRKTWYGTHSVRGVETTSILFSIMQSCKLNGVNSREYLSFIINQIHSKKIICTPSEYKLTK
jgi:transposase